jgi:hypothetical protein
MRKTLLTAALMLLALTLIAVAADDAPWFDMKKCEFCNKLAAQPGLVEHMKTEYHQLHNGTISVVHIDPEYKGAFTKALASMAPVVKALQSGQKPYTCPHCTMLGELYLQGVVPDMVSSGDAMMEIYTSNDSTMVKKLQEFGQKSQKGMEALVAEMSQPKK